MSEVQEVKTMLEEMKEATAKAFPKETLRDEDEVITVKDLDQLVEDIFTAGQVIEEAGRVVTEMNKKLAGLKAKGVRFLKALDKADYKSEVGTIRISQKWRVNLPATDEDKAALFAYLREKGLFETYATVNSASLNAYYMAEWAAAKKIGAGVEFAIPGIGERKMFEDLGMTKTRSKKQENENE